MADPARTTAAVDGSWCLYQAQWMIVQVVDAGNDAEAHLWACFAERYGGRLRDEDARVVTFDEDARPARRMEVRLYNQTAQFDCRARAEAFVAEHAITDYTLAVRDSPAERELRGYGTRRLKS